MAVDILYIILLAYPGVLVGLATYSVFYVFFNLAEDKPTKKEPLLISIIMTLLIWALYFGGAI